MLSKKLTGSKAIQSLPYVFFFMIAALLVYTFLDYGITWDEEQHYNYGKSIFNYYASLGRERSNINLFNIRYYGGFFDFTSHLGICLGRVITGKEYIYEIRHFVNIVFGFVSLLSLFFIGKRLNNPWGGYLAVGILMLTPRYYGHMFSGLSHFLWAS